ncbi:recombinase family protein [Telmatospirillum sp.]|uniref:recombinase family protein n=1 Tax=Telmatospirillum sp. TaxID=2079197 RepID=UPI00283E7D13|nr:recombinase family protein [Telmatospirillum sp.]MDR3438928.1 recombinase family protein [Telmatospirillum sp.]
MTRVALYARYSSDNQSPASIEDQLRLCRQHAERQGWTVVDSYSDRAMSGASLLRPGIQDLMADAQRNRFEIVLAEALDRLSRDQEDIAGLYKRLSFAGIGMVTVSEGEIGELHIGLKGTMNALFLRDLAQKIRRGQTGRALAGSSPGGLSYGYDVVREFDPKGEPIRGKRRVNESQAPVIRRIFADYVAGISPRKIAATLNQEGGPSPFGGFWNASTINGSRSRKNGILYNEAYIGLLIYNRTRFDKDPDTGKRLSRLRPQADWVVTEAPHLRIVPDELWDAAQARKTRSAGQPAHQLRRPKHLFSGLVFCGCCGAAFTIKSKDQLACAAHREKGTCDNGRTIRMAELERRVLAPPSRTTCSARKPCKPSWRNITRNASGCGGTATGAAPTSPPVSPSSAVRSKISSTPSPMAWPPVR